MSVFRRLQQLEPEGALIHTSVLVGLRGYLLLPGIVEEVLAPSSTMGDDERERDFERIAVPQEDALLEIPAPHFRSI